MPPPKAGRYGDRAASVWRPEEPPFTIVPAAAWSAMALFAPAFETIPFSVSVVAGAVALFALALVAKDGLVMIVALLVLAAAVVGGMSLLG